MLTTFLPNFGSRYHKPVSMRRIRSSLSGVFMAHMPTILRRSISLILFVALWQFMSVIDANLLINFQHVPAPTEVFDAFITFMGSSPWIHFQSSITRVLVGFSFGALLGIIAGLLIGSSHALEEIFGTPLEVLRPIPAVAWIPLAILMFPDAESGMYYITFVGAFYPILISTQKSVEDSLSDRLMVRVGQSLGANSMQLFRDIIFPSSLPGISAGLVIGMGNAWFCLVTAEIISGRHGVGYRTWESYVTSEYPPIVMGMILIGALGAFSSYILQLSTDQLMPWRSVVKGKL